MKDFKYQIGEKLGTYEILDHWVEKTPSNCKSKKNNCRVFYKCKCTKCGYILERTRQDHVDSLKMRTQCQNCKSNRKDNFKYKIGEIVNNNLLILDCYRKCGIRYYKYQCTIDGYIGDATESNIIRGQHCPVCTHCKLVPGLNDFNTLYPQFAKFLVNYEEGCNIGVGENSYADFICPNCGKILKHKNIRSIIRYGYISCDQCGKQSSNAEKIMKIILSINNIEYVSQAKFKEWGKKYIYDFYLPQYNLIIETNGRQHYEEVKSFKNSLLVQQNIDEEKEKLAIDNGYNFLSIDCRFKDIYDLVNKIINKLTLLELPNKDLDEIIYIFTQYKHNNTEREK